MSNIQVIFRKDKDAKLMIDEPMTRERVQRHTRVFDKGQDTWLLFTSLRKLTDEELRRTCTACPSMENHNICNPDCIRFTDYVREKNR